MDRSEWSGAPCRTQRWAVIPAGSWSPKLINICDNGWAAKLLPRFRWQFLKHEQSIESLLGGRQPGKHDVSPCADLAAHSAAAWLTAVPEV